MNNLIIVLSLPLVMVHSITVQPTDKCDSCTQLKSQNDCLTFSGSKCTWKEKTVVNDTHCFKKVDLYVPFCSNITSPKVNCAQYRGCAYVENKCVQFPGCSAFAKTSHKECQSISIQCISDGKQCQEVQECSSYSKDQCESTPSKSSPYKCKLEEGFCRTYHCSEADVTLTTDKACNAWRMGCKSTGQGCIDIIPTCSEYTGTITTCPLMMATDGICDFDSIKNTCKARDCSNAPTIMKSDSDCDRYKKGCVTTGKGCIEQRLTCSNYSGNDTSCLGYIGSDGECFGDPTGTYCRTKKCDDYSGITNQDCKAWKQGCFTNGKNCVSYLPLCRFYSSNACEEYIGSDGYCKSDSTSTCTARDCQKDSKGNENTDAECQLIQSYCKTTGKGCTNKLELCSTYSFEDDGSSCLKLIGVDGKCKAGPNFKCTVKLCDDSPITMITNKACHCFQPGCVTTGAGCTAQQKCTDITKQITCEGSHNCGWNSICINNTSCSQFSTKSLCNRYKVNNRTCIWDQNICKDAICSDFQGTTDNVCDEQLQGCVSNGVDCVDGTDCSKFKGTQSTCQKFKASCTNHSSITSPNSLCVPRTCDDDYLTHDRDQECENYLSSCVTKGKGCISKSSPCSAYFGTPQQCDKFKGNYGTVNCWNTQASGKCIDKVCAHANGMIDNQSCDQFLPGCLYNGKGGCVYQIAPCDNYSGDAITCLNFKGNNGQYQCYIGQNGKCKNKECTDNKTATSDSDCDAFLSGCVTNGLGCVHSSQECSSYRGTTSQCNKFIGNKKQCTRLDACVSKACSKKIDAKENADCLNYHSKCRLMQGTQTCMDAPIDCSGFNNFALGASNDEKLTYCNTVKDQAGNICGFDFMISAQCSVRQCKLWNSILAGTSCFDYLGIESCRLDGDGKCYAPEICSNYQISEIKSDTDKLIYCNSLLDNSQKHPKKCTYDITESITNCSPINNCEEIISPSSAADCNLFLKNGMCQYYNGKCYTTRTDCTLYSINNMINNQTEYCSSLKQVDASSAVQCIYLPSQQSNCMNSCLTIVNPTAQADCDIYKGCKFYSNTCYAKVSCQSYQFPDSINTDILKQLFCQNMYDGINNKFCSWDEANKTCSSPKESCFDYNELQGSDEQKLKYCMAVRDQSGMICDFKSGTTCTDPQNIDSKCSSIKISISSEYECDIRTLPFCKSTNNSCIVVSACSEHYVAGIQNKLGACQSKTDNNGNQCTYSSGDYCDIGKDDCTDWNSLPEIDQQVYCSSRIDKKGIKCYWIFEANCVSQVALKCSDIFSPNSQADCDIIVNGCIYNYEQQMCYSKPDSCNSIVIESATQEETQSDKVFYCNSFYNSLNSQCTYLSGKNCVDIGSCSTYSVNYDISTVDKILSCQTVDTTDLNGCTYFGFGEYCIQVTNCTKYINGDSSTCGVLNSTSKKCKEGLTNSCDSVNVCEDIPNPKGILDCNIYINGCMYYENQCITYKNDCTYSYNGNQAKNYCNGIKNANGDHCTAETDFDTICKQRTCNDLLTFSFFTHSECKAYLSICKSNGIGCIDANTTCEQQYGNPTFCSWAKKIQFIILKNYFSRRRRKLLNLTNTIHNCSDFDCTQNVISTTDDECKLFNSACLTRGKGCISKYSPCDNYYGTKISCQKFVGNGIKCWSDSELKASCRDRICVDKQVAKDQADCDYFLSGCIYNGIGCVDSNASCTQYIGTQADCVKFMGLNKSQYCWGTTNNVQQCTIRKCSDKKGTSDYDCNNFMPPISPALNPLCITDGTNCVEYGKPCSFFKGDNETCAKFTSIEGICKASTSSCVPRVCYEAPNNYTTDEQCEAYQRGCKTTGRGCSSAPQCGDFQTQSVCQAISQCQWASQCRTLPTDCGSQSQFGQSVCINTPLQNGNKCAWYNGICRNYTCSDYDINISKHHDCYSKDPTCTTSGTGCITIGICSQYINQAICEIAHTTEASIKCTWNTLTNSCRQRECGDGAFTTDHDCNAFLFGCKSSGAYCIGRQYGCNVFTGFPESCQANSAGVPCLYVDDVCYDFQDCTDAPFNTLEACQKFSNLCVPNISACMAITFCEKYEVQAQCTIGLTKIGTQTSCGWLPAGKCAAYTNCGDVVGNTLQECLNWNPNCVSNGRKCVDKGTCISYLTEIECGNTGTDGLCKWTGSACRLRECGDNTTDTDCASYAIGNQVNVCTTDGVKCVLRAACSSYTEQGCFYGSDGIPCVFDYLVGTTTGIKLCRPKECADIKGATNDQCVGQIPNKKCVSDGTTCVKQDTCSSYKNKISCQGGGLDGACAFTPLPTTTNQNTGTCTQFKSCESANNDQDACKIKSSQCKWIIDAYGRTSCKTIDCATAQVGRSCVAVPNFDNSQYTICVIKNGVCIAGDPSAIAQEDCYKSTLQTFTWNEYTNKCVQCKGPQTTNNYTGNSTTNNTNSNTTNYAFILVAIIHFVILVTF